MKYCTKCGQEIAEDAKFCDKCGTQIKASTSSGTEKKTVNGDKMHKCPRCGEVLKAFETVCPACDYELRDVKSLNSVKDLAEKLEQTPYEKQQINIIKNFPIPNTKEDIFEFMLLSSSNFDVTHYVAHIDEEDIAHAWLAKIEQCYQKAKLSFGSHLDFKKIEDMYFNIHNACEEKESEIKHKKKEQQIAKESVEKAEEFKKSKFRIVLIVFAIFSAFCCTVDFSNVRILEGLIALTQMSLFIVAFLMYSNIIKEKIKNTRYIPTILAFVLIIPYIILL